MPGIINPLDPIGSQVEQMAIDRQRALAAALQQQSMSPTEGQMVSGHYVAPSWTQFAAKLAQGLSGKSMNEDLDKKTVDYQTRAMQQMVGALGGAGGQNVSGALAQGAAAGSIGPTTANAARLGAAPSASAGPSDLNPAGMNPKLAAYMLMSKPEEYWKAQTAALAPTDATKMATQGGVDPRAANRGALDKANFIPPIDVKPGGTLVDPRTNKPLFNAPEANGNRFTYDDLGNPTMSRTAGADATLAAAAAAPLRGTNSQTLAPESAQEVLPDGRKVIRTVGETIGGGSAHASGGKQGLDISKMAPAEIEALKKIDPEAFQRGVERFAVGAKFGQKEGIEGQQKELVAKWEPLNAANQQAETAISYLQNIKGLANKAATGGQAERLTFVNGLLSLVGDKGAADMVTANNLLDKYSNQIVARMSTGGMGTDAARAVLASANPSSKMNPAAISEAVDNIIGGHRLSQAKAAILAPYRNGNDAKGYTEKDITFDQAADPRIWQYASMPAPERAAFKAKLAQQGIAAEFGNKIRTLESLGVKF